MFLGRVLRCWSWLCDPPTQPFLPLDSPGPPARRLGGGKTARQPYPAPEACGGADVEAYGSGAPSSEAIHSKGNLETGRTGVGQVS